MFIKVLFISVSKLKTAQVSIGKEINCSIVILRENYSAIKQNEILIHITT